MERTKERTFLMMCKTLFVFIYTYAEKQKGKRKTTVNMCNIGDCTFLGKCPGDLCGDPKTGCKDTCEKKNQSEKRTRQHTLYKAISIGDKTIKRWI